MNPLSLKYREISILYLSIYKDLKEIFYSKIGQTYTHTHPTYTHTYIRVLLHKIFKLL